MKPASLFNIFFVALAALVLTACSDSETSADDKPVLTVSLRPQQYMLEQIAGDGWEVRSLLHKGSDPESFDPSLSAMVETQKSAAYMPLGNFPFEEGLIKKLQESNPDLPVFITSRGIVPITDTHGDGHADPHVWVSVKNALVIAANMREAMIAIDPDNASVYNRNYERFAAKLNRLHSKIAASLASHHGEAFLVWHPSLSYFARDYGLQQIAVGGMDHKESSIPEMRGRIDRAAESGARVFFFQKNTDSRHAEAVTDMVTARRVEISPLSYDWVKQIKTISDALANEKD